MYPSPEHHKQALMARFNEEFDPKYDTGQEIHGGELYNKPGVIRNVKQEVLDQWSYVCTTEDQLRVVKKHLENKNYDEALAIVTGMLAEPID